MMCMSNDGFDVYTRRFDAFTGSGAKIFRKFCSFFHLDRQECPGGHRAHRREQAEVIVLSGQPAPRHHRGDQIRRDATHPRAHPGYRHIGHYPV